MKTNLNLFLSFTFVGNIFGQTNAHYAKANALSDNGKWKPAVSEINLAIKDNLQMAKYYVLKSNCQIKLKEYKEALVTLTSAIKLMPDTSSLYDARGVLLESFNIYDQAIRDFTSAYDRAQTDKERAHYLSNRGGSQTKIRQFHGAYKDLKMAVGLDTTNIAALSNLSSVCDEVGKPQEGLLLLQKIISIDSTFCPAYINLGMSYQARDEHERAIICFNKAVKLQPDEPLGYSNRSFSKLKMNDLEGATTDINQSLKLLPTNSYAYKIRALILIKKGQAKLACEDLHKSSELGYKKQYGDEVETLLSKNCN